jgi:hypothetical protein
LKDVLAVKQTTLEEKVSLYVRAAEKHVRHVAPRRHHGGVYQVSVPTEDVATLTDQPLRSFDLESALNRHDACFCSGLIRAEREDASETLLVVARQNLNATL